MGLTDSCACKNGGPVADEENEEQQIPYGHLHVVAGQVIGVQCPVCEVVLAETNPMKAGQLYADHYHSKHGSGTV
jgi:hypothetical protein